MKKRFLLFLMIVTVLTVMLPVSTLAADPETICGLQAHTHSF